MEAVKEIVAEKGMDGFSIRQAAERTGINEALIYRDFDTKNHLLDVCYKDVQDKVSRIYDGLPELDLSTQEKVTEALRDMWMMPFLFLLEHKSDTLFLRSYRESSYRSKLLIASQNREPSYFFDTRDKFATIFPKNMDPMYSWVYIIDISIELAVKMLKGELPNTKESVMTIWNIMYGGLLSSTAAM